MKTKAVRKMVIGQMLLSFALLSQFGGTMTLCAKAETQKQRTDASAENVQNGLQSSYELNRIQMQLNRTKDTHHALEQLQDLLKREPQNAEAHMMCGKVLQLLGFEDLADQEYKAADNLDPTKPDSVLSLFHNRLEQNGYKAAYEYLQYVQRRFPYDPSVLIMQGLLARMSGNQIEAEFFYTLAMEHHPNTPGLATALASLRLLQKRYREAIKLADRDLILNKNHPAANLAKGEALLCLGQTGQAIPYLESSYRHSTDKKGSADILSRALISNSQLGDALEPTLVCMYWTPLTEQVAIAQLKQRLLLILKKTGPEQLLNTLGVVQREASDSEKVAYLYFASGDVLAKATFPRAAEEAFKAGLVLRPISGRPYLRLGILKEIERDYQAALADYAKAHDYAPKDRECAARLLRLIRRASIQEYDLAWTIKDFLAGGRTSLLYKPAEGMWTGLRSN